MKPYISLILAISFSTSAHSASCNFLNVGGTLVDFDITSVSIQQDYDAVGMLRLQCTDAILPNIPVTISVDEGSSNSFVSRTLVNGPSSITYNMYTDALRQNVFGDGSAGSNTSTIGMLCVNSVECNVPIYGRIDGGQAGMAGQYSDDILVTAEF